MKKAELGEWLKEFSCTCSICGKPYKYTPAGDTEYTGGIHCHTCHLGLAAIQAMVTVESKDKADAGRGFYVRMMLESVFVRLHKLSERVAELEAKR